MVFFNLNYNQLLLYGVHVGHSLSNTLLYSAWMVSAFRQSISIINLFKSIVMFRLSFLILTNIIAAYGPVWFINLDKSVDRYVRYAALNCGEFSVTNRWIRGSISNYRIVFNAYRRLMDLPGTVLSSKKKSFNNFFNNWFLTRYSWPRAVFISSLHTSYFPAKEALSLKIPSISIVDTNSWTQATSIAIPGNDESLGCLVFYNDIMSNFILSRKFNLVSIWFFNIRSISRIVSFTDWISKRYTLNTSSDLFNLVTFKPNILNSYLKSFGLFLSNNYWSTIIKDRLDVFYFENSLFDASFVFPNFLAAKKRIIMTLNFHFFKKMWIFKGFFKKKFFTDRNFKSKFLLKDYFYKKFLTKKYLRHGLLSNNINSDFFLAISNLYFLQKYLTKISIPNISKAKLKYWNLISGSLVHKFLKKSKVWNLNFNVRPFVKNISFSKKNYRKVSIKISNKMTYLAKSNSTINKLKFYVSNYSFDSYLPKYLWYWNVNSFVTNKNSMSDLVNGYFFRKSSSKGNSFYFKGFLNSTVNKDTFPKIKGYKWIWF